MKRFHFAAGLSVFVASVSLGDVAVTNSWIYHAVEAYSAGRWCSYLYKDGWSLQAMPTADQIVEFSPGAESKGVNNSLILLCCNIDTADAESKDQLAFRTDGFYAKGLVIHATDSASDARLEHLYFSSCDSNFLKVYLGSEGLTMYGSGTSANTFAPISLYDAQPLTLTASQTWRIGTEKWMTTGRAGNWMTFTGDLSSEPNVTWRILGKSILRFTKGDSAALQSTSADFGGRVYANSGFMMDGASQVNRLGTNSVEITCETVDGERAFPSLLFRFGDNADTSWDPVSFAAPLSITATNPSIYDAVSAEITAFAVAVESKNGQRTWIRFPKGIRGTYGNKCFAFTGEQSGADDGGVYPARRHSSQMRRDTARIVLDGDNSGLVPQASTDRILLKTVVMPAHAHALGANNAATMEIMMPTLWGGDGVGMVGVIASNGVSVASALGTTGWFNGTADDNSGIHPTVILGSEGPGTTHFTGDANLVRSSQGEDADLPSSSMNVILTADKGGTAAFDGKIRAGRYVTVNGKGDVALNNAANVFPRALGLSVRSGRLVAGANGAIGNGTIRVGEAAARYTVRAVQTGRFLRDSTIKGNAPTISSDDGVTPTKIEFTKNVTVDGVMLKRGDKVLVASTDYLVGSKILDGVFTVTDDAAKTWELDPAFDTQAGRLGLYGARIHVTEGDRFAGRDFYWAEHLGDRATKPTKLGSSKFAIYDDAAENPDTGLLASSGVTVANDVVIANDGTGRTEIGAATAGTCVFTGTVTVEKPTLEIYAPAGATVTMAGLLKNMTGKNLKLVKTGPGHAVLNQLDSTVTDISIVDGTLKFVHVVVGVPQPLLHLDAMDDQSLTKVTETVGGTEVTSVTRWADVRGANHPYVRSCRDAWIPKVADWPWSIPRHNKDWHYLIATRNPVYRVTTVKPGLDLPSLDLLDSYYYDGSDGVESVDDMKNETAAFDVYVGNSVVPYIGKGVDSPFMHVREAFVVVKDNDTSLKMSLLGTTDSSNVEYYRRGADGSIITSEAASETGNVRTDAVKNGQTRVDGAIVADVTTEMLSPGFHVVSFCPASDTTVATLGLRTSRQLGGIQYGEVIVYTNALTATEHDKVEAELLAKWLGVSLPDSPATVDSLAIGCVFKEGVMTGSLDMGGRFKPAVPCVINVTCDDVKPEPGDYLLLAAKSVETDGSDWTINAVGVAKRRIYQIVKKADGRLYLRVIARGLVVNVR